MNEAASWMALALARGVGTRSIVRLIRRFGSASEVWRAGKQQLLSVPGIGKAALDTLLKGPDMDEAARALDIISEYGAWMMTCNDDDYPEALQNIPDFPPIIFGKGSRRSLSARCVAVVGSRAASSYGRRVAADIASGLATEGFCVVSGLALGIDSAAHRSCLDSGGQTVAVTGSGINVIYPARNRKLARQISEQGAVITEFPPDVHPEPRNFPRRNRIISGLSAGVIVVEAGHRSGSLITASMALEQGREVMAVPGSIYSFNSAGTHWLIRQGAALVTCAADVTEALGWHGAGEVKVRQKTLAFDDTVRDMGPAGEGKERFDVSSLSEKERLIFENIEHEPVHIDELCAICSISASEAAGLLVQLELKGIVSALPGQMYSRAV